MNKRHLLIGTVSNCNAKCRVCPSKRASKGVMSYKLWCSIINQIKTIRDEFFGCRLGIFGEPLLDKGFLITNGIFDKVEYFNFIFPKNRERRIPLGLNTTTAFLLSDQIIDKIIHGFDGLGIHVESIYPHTYNILMPGLDYNVTLRNVNALIKRRNELGERLHILIATPVHKYNINELKQYRDFWIDQGVDEVSFDNLSNRCGTLETFEDLAIRDGNIVNGHCAQDTAEQYLIIDWDGKVLLCCNDFDRNLILGDAAKESITSILSSLERAQVAKLLELGKHEEISTCSSCRFNIRPYTTHE